MQQNFLSPTGFTFAIQRLPTVSFFVQAASIPGISMTPQTVATPFSTMYFGGDKFTFDTFNITIRVDEYMESYNEIYNWIVGITRPTEFKQYANLIDGDGVYSDASLLIHNSRQIPSLEVKFKDAFPISLGAINLDTTVSDINYQTCEITFAHNGHSIKRIGA